MMRSIFEMIEKLHVCSFKKKSHKNCLFFFFLTGAVADGRHLGYVFL